MTGSALVPQLVSGDRLGHYEVLGQLGQGGMGEVYRARDPRLEREVAVKILRRQLAEDLEARSRFEREVRAIAAMSHPNILAIYDVGVERGIPYSVTELLDGDTLRARLARGAVVWKTAVSIAAAAADGLAAAHDKGIVHRDIKPENLFLTRDDRLKILDFGLAYSSSEVWPVPAAPDSPTMLRTISGTVMGTLGYMAPEQLRGGSVGAQADIFSLGCVLYEMVTGRGAFRRDTPADTVSAILNAEAPPFAGPAVEAPVALDRVIRHCLEKAPSRRFRSARDLAESLRALLVDSAISLPLPRVTARARGASHGSVAVLPFTTSGDAPDLEYLGEGIAESVINALAGMRGVRVVPRTLAFRYAGREDEPRALGIQLNAQTILSGRLLVRGDQLHVQADLVDTSDESQIWGSRFVRPTTDLEALAPKIADDIREALRSRFDARPARSRRSRKQKTTASAAYREFLRGRHHWNKWTRDGVLSSIDAFRAAIEIDPAYAPAYAGLADAYGAAAYSSYMPASEALPLARHAAMKALDIDPNLAEAHATLGVAAMFFEWNWDEAGRLIARAREQNDRSLTAHVYNSLYLICRGRTLDALEAARQAERIDPMSLLAMSGVAWGLLHTGDLEAAESQLHRMLGVDPEFPDALILLAHIAEARGAADVAAGFHRRWFRKMGLPDDEAATLLTAHAEHGWTGYRRRYLDLLDRCGDVCDGSGHTGPCVSVPVVKARIHALLGEVEAALDALDRACELHTPMLAFAAVDLHLASLRGHPRFEALLQRIGLS